tara:strand:+ start:323 stop:505 length:183 start_codon:yes stop_codon:yes gene_type:complete
MAMGSGLLYYPFPAGAGEKSSAKIYINQWFPVPVLKQIAFLLVFLHLNSAVAAAEDASER